MSMTAQDETQIENSPLDDAVGDSHLADAEKFFSSAEETGAEPEAKPAEKAPEKPAENPLSKVLKTGEKTPAEEAPKADPQPDDLDQLTPPKDEKAKAGWEDLKRIAREAREEAARAKSEAEQLRTKAVEPEARAAIDARVQQLESENKQLSDRLKVLDLKNHPDFQRQFQLPEQKALENLKKRIEGVDWEGSIESVLALPEAQFAAQISELGSQLPEYTKTQVYALADQIRSLRAQANDALGAVDQTLDQYRAGSQQHAKAVFDQVAQEYAPGKHFAAQEVADDASPEEKASVAAYNQAFQSVRTTAENLAFGQVDESSVARMAHEAALYRFTVQHGLPRLGEVISKEFAAREAKIAQLEAKLAKISSSKPAPSYGSEDNDKAVDPTQMDHLEAAKLVAWGNQ